MYRHHDPKKQRTRMETLVDFKIHFKVIGENFPYIIKYKNKVHLVFLAILEMLKLFVLSYIEIKFNIVGTCSQNIGLRH